MSDNPAVGQVYNLPDSEASSNQQCDSFTLGRLQTCPTGPSTCLVIGIGNLLRRDDGVGPWLARQVAVWNLPGVTTRCVHQLTPETAAEMVAFDRVVFIDAAMAAEAAGIVPVAPATTSHGWGHELEPEEVLALTAILGGPVPAAFVLPVHGTDFSVGEGFSDEAKVACARAIGEIQEFLREREPSCSPLPSGERGRG